MPLYFGLYGKVSHNSDFLEEFQVILGFSSELFAITRTNLLKKPAYAGF